MDCKRWILAVAAGLIGASACREAPPPKLSYPATTRGDTVESYFGTKVADPYRWMEEIDSLSR